LTAAVSSLDEEPTALPVGDPTLDALLANRRRNTALAAAAAAAAAAEAEVEEEEEEEEHEDAVPTGAPTPLGAFKQGPCDIQAGCTLPKWHRGPCSVPPTFSLPKRQKKDATAAASVARIMEAADWRAVLRLPADRRLTSASIKQAWKAVSFEVHPDRCKAPGAEDAFKRAGEARDALEEALEKEEKAAKRQKKATDRR
jgi:hypothetical protein